MMNKNILMASLAFIATACQESLEERAAREAREMTETKCPIPVGDNLLLDSVVFDIPSLTQSQYFSVQGALDDDSLLNTVDTRALLLDELRNAPSYRPLMERGVAFHYVYYSSSAPGRVLLEQTLTPVDYGRP